MHGYHIDLNSNIDLQLLRMLSNSFSIRQKEYKRY